MENMAQRTSNFTSCSDPLTVVFIKLQRNSGWLGATNGIQAPVLCCGTSLFEIPNPDFGFACCNDPSIFTSACLETEWLPARMYGSCVGAKAPSLSRQPVSYMQDTVDRQYSVLGQDNKIWRSQRGIIIVIAHNKSFAHLAGQVAFFALGPFF